jgi:hypothetical protein
MEEKRGGKREGAGRKPKFNGVKTTTVRLFVPVELKQQIIRMVNGYCESKGYTPTNEKF